MPEWLIGAVLKTVVPSRVPRVRIPIPPPFKRISLEILFFVYLTVEISHDSIEYQLKSYYE